MSEYPLRLDRSGAVRGRMERDGETMILALQGEIDLASAEPIAAMLREIEDAGSLQAIVLDLRAVSYMDSTGVRMLVQADKRAREAGYRFAVVDGSGPVHRILGLVGLAGAFPVVDASSPFTAST